MQVILGVSRPVLELARNLDADEATAEMMLCARKPSEPLSLYLAFLVFSGLLKKNMKITGGVSWIAKIGVPHRFWRHAIFWGLATRKIFALHSSSSPTNLPQHNETVPAAGE